MYAPCNVPHFANSRVRGRAAITNVVQLLWPSPCRRTVIPFSTYGSIGKTSRPWASSSAL